MSAGHDHGTVGASQRTLGFAFLLTLSFFFVELIGGFWTGSLALIADAGHMISDAAALAFAWVAAWLATRPADELRTYGYRRWEVLAALINGLALWLIAGLILHEAWERFQDPQAVMGLEMAAIAAVGLLINLALVAVLHRGAESNLNMRGALLHVIGDALGSVAALGAGVAIRFGAPTWLDPLAGALVCLLILYSAWRIVKESTQILLEGTPPGIDPREVQQAMEGVAGVCEVHDLHVWCISSGFMLLSAHAVVEDQRENERILEELQRAVHDRFHIEHVTVQIEAQNVACHQCDRIA